VPTIRIIELVARSSVSYTDAIRNAKAEAERSFGSVRALDVISTGLRGQRLDEWHVHLRALLWSRSSSSSVSGRQMQGVLSRREDGLGESRSPGTNPDGRELSS
jgi:flavin-binding protein dodecin